MKTDGQTNRKTDTIPRYAFIPCTLQRTPEMLFIHPPPPPKPSVSTYLSAVPSQSQGCHTLALPVTDISKFILLFTVYSKRCQANIT